MCEWYHDGAYGKFDASRWSCCKEGKRDSQGCRKTSTQRPRLSSLSAHWQREAPSQEPTDTCMKDELFGSSVPLPPHWGDEEVQHKMYEIKSSSHNYVELLIMYNTQHVYTMILQSVTCAYMVYTLLVHSSATP